MKEYRHKLNMLGPGQVLLGVFLAPFALDGLAYGLG